VLTSALKKVDVAVTDAIKRAQAGKFAGGTDLVATVKTGGIGIGKFNTKGSKYADQVKKIQDQIAAGSISIPDTVGGK
jgi:basic membrane protein A